MSIFYTSSLLVSAADYTAPASNLGCYSSISGGDSKGDYTYQTSGYCVNNECPNSPYVAVKGKECICLNSLPQSSSKVSSSQCDQPCPGYQSDMCGGSNAYNVYKGLASASSSSSSNLGSVSSSSPSSSGSPSSSQSSSITGSLTIVMIQIKVRRQLYQLLVIQMVMLFIKQLHRKHQQLLLQDLHLVLRQLHHHQLQLPHPTQATPDGKSEKKSSSVGAIVGGVVGIGGLILLVAGGFFYMRYRNNDEDEDEEKKNFMIINLLNDQMVPRLVLGEVQML